MEALEREIIWLFYRIASFSQYLDNSIFGFPVFWHLYGRTFRDIHSFLWVRFLKKVLTRQECVLANVTNLLKHEQSGPLDAVATIRVAKLLSMQAIGQNTVTEIKKAIRKWERVA